jgi:hypothetical protein
VSKRTNRPQLSKPPIGEIASALFKIINHSGHSQLEGIEIDLHHPDLDLQTWKLAGPEFFIGIDHQPSLIFPWQERERKKTGKRWPATNDGSQPRIVVKRGDMVRIARVETVKIGPEYGPESDREAKHVFLEFRDKSGETIQVDKPLIFLHSLSSHTTEFGRDITLGKLAHRIKEALGITLPADFSLALTKYTGQERALLETLRSVINSSKTIEAELTDETTWKRVSDLIDHAVCLGYMFAGYEADKGMGPLAEKALRSRQGSQITGRKRGEALKGEAEATRQRILPLAVQYRSQAPELSQTDLAAQVKSQLGKRVPGVRAIELHIRKLEKSGRLDRRVKPISR